MRRIIVEDHFTLSLKFIKEESGYLYFNLRGYSLKLVKKDLEEYSKLDFNQDMTCTVIVKFKSRVEKVNNVFCLSKYFDLKDLEDNVVNAYDETFIVQSNKFFKKRKSMDEDLFYTINDKKEYTSIMNQIIEEYIQSNQSLAINNPRNAKTDWSEGEALVALEFYFRSYGMDSIEQKKIAADMIAKYGLNRTVEALILKGVCFRSLDPHNPSSGMGNFGTVFVQVWEDYSDKMRKKVLHK